MMKTIKIPFIGKVIVDRKELNILEEQREAVRRLLYYVITQPNPTYSVTVDYGFYIVSMETPCGGVFPIKAFPIGDNKEYARLCAEELCEMLNSKM